LYNPAGVLILETGIFRNIEMSFQEDSLGFFHCYRVMGRHKLKQKSVVCFM